MKKILSVLLIIALLICTFVGCNNNETKGEETTVSTTQQSEETTNEKESSTTETESETTEPQSEEETELTTEKVTEEATEKATEKPTEKPTVKPTEKVTEKNTKPAEPNIQLYKTYYCHTHKSDTCEQIWFNFQDNGRLEIVKESAITEASPYYEDIISLREEGIELSAHEHNGVKYYSWDGAGYVEEYHISDNKITTIYEGTYTIISNTSIKRSDGATFNIIADNSRFE